MDRVGAGERLLGALLLVPEIWIEELRPEDCDVGLVLEDQAEEVGPVGIGRVRADAQRSSCEAGGRRERGVSAHRAKDCGSDPSWKLEGGERADSAQERGKGSQALDIGVDVDASKAAQHLVAHEV